MVRAVGNGIVNDLKQKHQKKTNKQKNKKTKNSQIRAFLTKTQKFRKMCASSHLLQLLLCIVQSRLVLHDLLRLKYLFWSYLQLLPL